MHDLSFYIYKLLCLDENIIFSYTLKRGVSRLQLKLLNSTYRSPHKQADTI